MIDPALIKAVRAALKTFSSKRRYLVGVSGGRDSVALLHALIGLGFQRSIAVHFDHRLRGNASAADARFVKSLAKKCGLECEAGSADVRSFATEHKLSIETAARQLRYAFFGEAARKWRCRTILLGHHADDQVETFFFNLLRGAGPAGLSAMQPASQRGGLRIVRPMLGVWRAEIDEYIRVHGLKFREDISNEDFENTRNKFRHRIIPWLSAEFGRDIRKPLWRTAEILSAEDAWMRDSLPPVGNELFVPALRALPVAIARRVIQIWLRKCAVLNCGFDEVEAVRALAAEGATKAKINLPGGAHARRRAGRLFVERAVSWPNSCG